MYTFKRYTDPITRNRVLDVYRDDVKVAQFLQSITIGAPVRMAITSDGGLTWWGYGLAGHPSLDAVQRAYEIVNIG